MNRKNKGLPKGFGDGYKGLPAGKRINVLFIAREFLKLQSESKSLFGDSGNMVEEKKMMNL